MAEDNFPAMTPAGVLTFRSKNVDGVHAPASTIANSAGALVDPGTEGTLQSILAALQSAQIVTNQVSVGTTATLICAARVGRESITIIQEGTMLVRLGGAGVTLLTGAPLPGTQYASFTIEGGAAVYGIVGSGTQTVSFVETF